MLARGSAGFNSNGEKALVGVIPMIQLKHLTDELFLTADSLPVTPCFSRIVRKT